MNKLRAFWKKVIEVLDNFLAYVMTIIGILISNSLSDFTENKELSFNFSWYRIGFAAIIALVVITKQEKTDGSIEAKIGKKNNFYWRMGTALSWGMTWAQLTQLSSK